MTPSLSRQTATWDATRQQAYRDRHPDSVFLFRLLLDASSSMTAYEVQLRAACNMYISWLKRHAPPMSLGDMRCFGTTLQASQVRPLYEVPMLSAETYTASYGGTALRDALGTVGTEASQPGQHVMILFTDGEDTSSTTWSAHQVQTLLSTLQAEGGWLAVFLGAFPEALRTGAALGFREGNCLTFASAQLPEAFETLRRATERYLNAPLAQRKLLAQSGVFYNSSL
jgi:hypothetical protein